MRCIRDYGVSEYDRILSYSADGKMSGTLSHSEKEVFGRRTTFDKDGTSKEVFPRFLEKKVSSTSDDKGRDISEHFIKDIDFQHWKEQINIFVDELLPEEVVDFSFTSEQVQQIHQICPDYSYGVYPDYDWLKKKYGKKLIDHLDIYVLRECTFFYSFEATRLEHQFQKALEDPDQLSPMGFVYQAMTPFLKY